MDSTPIQVTPVRRGRRWLWRSLAILGLLGSVIIGLRIYLDPHFEFRKEHEKHLDILTPVPVEHREPVNPPADWQTVTHFNIRLRLPPEFQQYQPKKDREKQTSAYYIEKASKSSIIISGPTDGRRDLRQIYDQLEIKQDFPSDVRPWATIYDYWLTIYTASYDQFSWTLSQQHVRELDWILRLRKQRLAVDFMMTKSSSVYSYTLGENAHARWIVQLTLNWHNEHFAQVFSKSDHRCFSINWFDPNLERGTDGILRVCNSVRFE